MQTTTNTSIKMPKSLRGETLSLRGRGAADPGVKLALACLAGAAWAERAEAEEAAALPALTVDQPAQRHRAAPPKPSPAHQRARASVRQMAKRHAQTAAARPAPQSNPAPAPTAPPVPAAAPDADPYAHPGAPYKVDHVASGSKFPESIADTAKTITVLSKEVLRDKNATELKDVARTTAGVTLGTGEGGNAFGDRFFIRGFDVRNDIFIDGVRDPGVSVRENFFTEQVEILRGPGSSFAGRGTTGGAINIVPKQATDQNFQTIEGMAGTDRTKRVTFDVNQVISPTLSVRAGGLLQGAGVAGRDVTTDNRNGAFLSVKWTPLDSLKITANYIHTDLSGIPDFGVPYYRARNAATGAPATEYGVNRDTYYGFANRDFQKAQQDIGTLNGELRVNDVVTLTNKLRVEHSLLDYVGTIPEKLLAPSANISTWTITANPVSRYQTTDVLADQAEAQLHFVTADVKHSALVGTEFSHEEARIQSYTGLTSESFGAGGTSSGSVSGVSVVDPQYTYSPFPTPALAGDPTRVPIDTSSVYLLDSANYRDFIIVNGGVRLDDYHVSASNNEGGNSVHSTLFNYNGGLVVKPLPFASLYAAYATSSDPVGQEFDATSAAYGGLSATAVTNQVFGPEKNRATEVGTKWELFDRKLLATAALFDTTKTNARETNGQTVVAGAAYRIEGVDLEMTGKVTDDWSVNAGLVLMRSRVTASNTAPANTTLYTTNVGLPLANIAHQSFNVLTKYQINPIWEVGAQATYMSQIYGGTLAANTGAVLPDHWRFDTFVEAEISKQVTLKVSVNNVFNKLYYDGFYRSLSPFVLVAPGRAAYLTLTAKF